MVSIRFSARIKDYLSDQFNLPEEQVDLMLPEFKKTLSQHQENLEEAVHQESLSALEKAAHTIKGAFLNLGLKDCAELAMKIEGGAAKNDMAVNYPELISDIGQIVDQIVKE